MSVINAVPLLAAAGGDYTISRSVRLRSSASAYFNRTLASSGSLRAWTWSAWVKRGSLNTQQNLFGWIDLTGGNFQQAISFESNNTLEFQMYNSVLGGYVNRKNTAQVFRDISAWYHIVVVWDSNNATAEDRARIYVNGVRVTAWANNTNPSLNLDSYINNSTYPLGIGRAIPSSTAYFDGYLTEVNFIDGQALTPTSFGQFNSVTGVWQPLKYTGTYGTNGFYLNFSDNSNNTATTIGKDYSGNGNNWTPNNISVTSGSTYDSMIDVPTQWADGGNGRGNYAVLNPLDKAASASVLNGNLRVTSGSATALGSRGTFQIPTTGKWYYEGVVVNSPSGSTPIEFGCATDSASLTALQATGSYGIYVSSAISYMNNGTASGSLGSLTAGDIIQFAGDCDNGRIWIGKNNVYWDASSGTTGNPSSNSNPTLSVSPASMFPLFLAYNNSLDANFGQRPFAYTPPSGFNALNTQNLPEPTISNGALYMAATTYTGNGGTQSITNTVNGVSFKPDLVWIKTRSATSYHQLIDSVRGVSTVLNSNYTGAESSYPGYSVTAFNSNGFTVVDNAAASYGVNGSTGSPTYVGWQWQAGQGTTSSNTSGSITSTVSVNATAGFSVVTFNAGSAGNQSFGHGLGVAPNMVILKDRANAVAWPVYHSSAVSATNQYLVLNLTAATQTSSGIWGAALPTSTVVGFGSNVAVTANANCVAYCFSAVPGYSAFGSYTGNGNSTDGPFVYLGFRPRWVMIKTTTTTDDWYMYDTSRNTYNLTNLALFADLSSAEATATVAVLDILSNGFKLRGAAGINAAQTYIYAAFAENPLKFSLAR